MSNKLRTTLIVLISLALAACVAFLALSFWQITESQRKNRELAEEVTTAPPSVSPADEANDTPAPEGTPVSSDEAGTEVLEAYRSLHERNPDMAGWLRIEGTNIDYPVMYTPDGDKDDPDERWPYLYHDFDGQEDVAGLPFIDERCTLSPRSTMILIHGHNMKDGSMFHDLRYYEDKDYFEEHPTIRFDTLYEEGTYQIVAVIKTQARETSLEEAGDTFYFHDFINAETEEEFDDYWQNILSLSLYDTGEEAAFGDELLTLSTCSYHVENGRLALIAKRVS